MPEMVSFSGFESMVSYQDISTTLFFLPTSILIPDWKGGPPVRGAGYEPFTS